MLLEFRKFNDLILTKHIEPTETILENYLALS